MRTKTDPVNGTESGAAALGAEERSDKAPGPKEEVGRCTRPGEVGLLLRREGLFISHLAAWRNGSLPGLTPNKRGAKPSEHNTLTPKVRQPGVGLPKASVLR